MGVAAVSPEAVREQVAELLGVSTDEVDPDSDLIGQGPRLDPDDVACREVAPTWRRRRLRRAGRRAVRARVGGVGRHDGSASMNRSRPLPDGMIRPPTRHSRWRPCSTPCGWAVKAISNSVVSQDTSTSSSTVTASTPTRLRASRDRARRPPPDAAGAVPARRHPAHRRTAAVPGRGSRTCATCPPTRSWRGWRPPGGPNRTSNSPTVSSS